MADKRATILISGEVQDAGFRGKVMRIAQKLELVGYIENLPNGTVRIICEGSEDAINNFVGKLDLHDDDIDVEDISLEWSDAIGEFEWFEVKFDNLGMEMFQGFATAGKKLSDVSRKVDESIHATKEVGQNVEAMHADLKNGFSDLKEETKKTHEKLDNIADVTLKSHDKLDNITNATATTHEKLDSIDGRLGDVIDRYGEFGEKMTHLEHNIGELTYQIKRLVEHVVGEEK